MNHMSLLALGTLLCTGLFATAQADTPKEYKDHEAMVEKLFKAYNKDDAKGVFENYTDSFKGMADQLYALLMKPNREKYGNYKSHKFLKDGSSTSEDNVLLKIEVEFEKEKKVVVGVNFGKEGKDWKIQQVVFAPPEK